MKPSGWRLLTGKLSWCPRHHALYAQLWANKPFHPESGLVRIYPSDNDSDCRPHHRGFMTLLIIFLFWGRVSCSLGWLCLLTSCLYFPSARVSLECIPHTQLYYKQPQQLTTRHDLLQKHFGNHLNATQAELEPALCPLRLIGGTGKWEPWLFHIWNSNHKRFPKWGARHGVNTTVTLGF